MDFDSSTTTVYVISYLYRPQTKFAKVIFSQVSVCSQGGGVHGKGVCMAGGMCGRGACMAGGCACQGCMHGWGVCMSGGHAWQGACMTGGMHGTGVCVAGGVWLTRGHAWQGGAWHAHPPASRYYEIWSMSGRYTSYWKAFLSTMLSGIVKRLSIVKREQLNLMNLISD